MLFPQIKNQQAWQDCDTLTFFFGLLLMTSSFGRLGDLLDSLLSTSGVFFCESSFSIGPSPSATKDFGWSPASMLTMRG